MYQKGLNSGSLQSLCKTKVINSLAIMLKNPKYVYGPVDRYVIASLNFGEFVLNKIQENRDTVALINGSTHEQLTYGEIAQEAMNIAVSLRRMGVRKGDVIALSSENRKEFWSTIIGIICSGAIASPISTGYKNNELRHVMGIAKPKYIFLSPLAYKTHAKNYNGLPYLKKFIIFGDDRHANTILYKDLAIPNSGRNDEIDCYSLTENIKHEEFQPADVNGGNDTLFILYSSGTTGLPKGVLITHLNVITLCSTPIPPLKGLSITPWYHTMGLISTVAGFTRGTTSVYLPKFDVDLYLKTVEKYQISQLTLVPGAMIALCKSNLKYITSSVQVVYCGAAPLNEETAKAIKKRFPSAQAVLQGYAMTETLITFNFNPEKIGSVGPVVSHTIVKVVNPETREVLGPNQEGEIYVKSVMLMKGYIGKDRKEDFDDEGFLRTGDIGYYDDDQYFYIVDRLKELIKYKAYQVPPAEIEAVLLKHSSIREAGVVGIPHPTAGEVPLAFVVLQPGETLTEKEIQDYVAGKLSNPKHLRGGVRFIDEIPKTQTGKMLKRELRKMANTRQICLLPFLIMLRNPKYLYGDDASLKLPTHLNFAKYVLQQIWPYKDGIALINGKTHEKLTFRELANDAMNLAISLVRMGVRKGDIIGICSENRQEYFSTLIGIICAGATVTCVNPAYTKGELKHVLDISKPKIIFCSPDAYKTHSKTLETLPYIQKFILFGQENLNNTLFYYENLAKCLTQVKGVNSVTQDEITLDNFEVVDVMGQIDAAVILYSSGTTGLPKGVLLTHLNLIATCESPDALDPKETVMHITPWYHTMGMMGVMRILCSYGTLVYLPKFDADYYMKTIETYKVVQIIVAPPVLIAVCKSRANYDVSSLRIVYSGAAPLRDDTIAAVKLRFPQLTAVLQGYGMTECTLSATRDTYLDAQITRIGGVGRVVPCCIMKIVDVETRKVLGPNQPGEICLKGPILMKGYIGKDTTDDFDDEGFFKTGDIGYYDEDKYVFIVDRLKELIKYKGYQVAPAEIEAVLLQHPGIRDAGVVGVPHETGGEVPRAFVVLQTGSELSEEEIKAFVAEKLSNPKHLRGGVRFVSEIPKNPSGKIMRRLLREMAKSKSKL